MKIISKYKDFYDYLAQDFDADIYYIRNPRWAGDLRLRKYYMSSYTYGYRSDQDNKIPYVDSKIGWSTVKPGDIIPGGVVFGVFPFVYSTPILKVYGCCMEEDSDVWKYPYVIYLGNNFVNSLKSQQDHKTTNKIITELVSNSVKNYNKSAKKSWWFEPNELAYQLSYKNKTLPSIEKYTKKIECPEIFEALDSPIFIEESDFIGDIDKLVPPNKNKGDEKKSQYLVDVSFNALNPDIIKYWYTDLCDLNTYNNIENFLWSKKQEPISQQTNTEKILSHGFDIKTSFRKM